MKCVRISETFANLVMDKYTFHTDCKSSAQHLTYCRVSVGSLILSNYFEKKREKQRNLGRVLRHGNNQMHFRCAKMFLSS